MLKRQFINNGKYLISEYSFVCAGGSETEEIE